MKNMILRALMLSLLVTGYSADGLSFFKKLGKNAVARAEIDQQTTSNRLQKERAALEKDEAALARAQSSGNVKPLAKLAASIAKRKVVIQQLEAKLEANTQTLRTIQDQQANMHVEDKRTLLADAKTAATELQQEVMRVKKEVIDMLNKSMKTAQSQLKNFEKKSANDTLVINAFNDLQDKISLAKTYTDAIKNAELNPPDNNIADDISGSDDEFKFPQFDDSTQDDGADDAYIPAPSPVARQTLRSSSSSSDLSGSRGRPALRRRSSSSDLSGSRGRPALRRSSSSSDFSGISQQKSIYNGTPGRRPLSRAGSARAISADMYR